MLAPLRINGRGVLVGRMRVAVGCRRSTLVMGWDDGVEVGVGGNRRQSIGWERSQGRQWGFGHYHRCRRWESPGFHKGPHKSRSWSDQGWGTIRFPVWCLVAGRLMQPQQGAGNDHPAVFHSFLLCFSMTIITCHDNRHIAALHATVESSISMYIDDQTL